MAHLAIRVLGDLQFFIDDVPVPSFESDKVRALLVYLAVESNRSHRRGSLVGLLWPDWPEQPARHNLRQALFNLRIALGDHTARPPYLLITRDCIQFNRESDYSLDLDRFNGYYSAWEMNQGRERVDPAALAVQLEDLVSLYTGEFLQQFYLGDSAEFEEWTLAQRESLHQRVMNALIYLANDAEKHADFKAAHRHALRQLELDPWREEAHAQLMRVLAQDGQRSAALVQYEACRRVLAQELGVEPSTKTRDLYEQIRQGKLGPPAGKLQPALPVTIQNLPVALTPFIGREQELADLGQLIASQECRCITLLGPGGIGKTRLALQAAYQHQHEFAHGSAFIPLASAASVEAGIPAIAAAVHLELYGSNEPRLQLINYLRQKHMLLVVDDVEHLLVDGPGQETIADLLIEILQQAAQVKLLVTSREAVNLQGEWLFEVQGLAFPLSVPADGLDRFSAISLFVQRARRALAGFALNAENTPGIVDLCRLVEGMPLAIELAATWVKLLSPAEIAAEIKRSLDFLNAQMRDLPERHRSMRAVFDHSWQTLSIQEKRVLGRLSVFRGGCQQPALQQVAGATLPVLSSLVARSLLRRVAAGRYDLHELVRQYAASKLSEDSQELAAAQEQHSRYYLALLVEKDEKLHARQQKEALAELALEMNNIRAAWDWAVAHQNWAPLYQACSAFCYLLELCNWFKEAESTFQKTTRALEASRSKSAAGGQDAMILHAMQAHCGYFRFRLGKGEAAYAVMEPSVVFFSRNGEPYDLIYSLWYLGLICWQMGRFAEARERLQECLALTRKHGRPWYEALAGEVLGSLARDEGAYGEAQQYLREAIALFRRQGDPMMISHGLTDLGRILYTLGEYGEAEALLRESLVITRELDCRFGIGAALDVLGQIASARSRQEEARALFWESASLFLEIGDMYRLSQTLNHQGTHFLACQDAAGAQNAFRSALKIACEGGLIPSVLDALAGLAALGARQEPGQETLALVLYILQHPSSSRETLNLASRLQAELEARLPVADVDLALHKAVSLDLNELVDQFLLPA